MSARIAKEEMALMMPNTLSHYFRDEPDAMPQGARQGATLFDRLAAAVTWMREMPRRRAVLNELEGLSARELADIGLTREDLPRVFDDCSAVRRSGRTATIA